MINSLPMTSVFLSPVIFTRINLPDTSLDGLNIPDRTEIDTDFPIDQFR